MTDQTLPGCFTADICVQDRRCPGYGSCTAVQSVSTPRRAVDADGVPWWIHECGMVAESAARPGPHACESCDHAPGPWRALHVEVLGG